MIDATIMSNTGSQSRTAAFTSTATTVVALLAIASAARMVPVGEVLVLHETRPAVRESSVVRAVAVAVAAAKDLLSQDQTTSTFDIAGPAAAALLPVSSALHALHTSAHLPTCRLGERLLDLPPPIV